MRIQTQRTRLLPVVAVALLAVLPSCISVPPLVVPTTTYAGAPTQTSLRLSYDRFKDMSMVSGPLFNRFPTNGPMMGATLAVMYQGQEAPAAYKDILLTVISTGREWALMRSSDLLLLIDGTERRQFVGRWGGDVGGYATTVETVTFLLTPQDVAQLGAARTIEGRIGIWSFTLTPEEIRNAREYSLFLEHSPNAARPVALQGTGGIPLDRP